MKLKSAKIFFFPILFLFFGLGNVSEALNCSKNIDIYSEKIELISKKGDEAKKSGAKKSEVKKKGDKKTQTNLNKFQIYNKTMREDAKEKYKKWKENKKYKKSNVDLESN